MKNSKNISDFKKIAHVWLWNYPYYNKNVHQHNFLCVMWLLYQPKNILLWQKILPIRFKAGNTLFHIYSPIPVLFTLTRMSLFHIYDGVATASLKYSK